MDITFDQAQYGGNGADGISLFLVDGATNLTSAGSFGGYLGYGGGGTGSPTGGTGVSGGLLNVGFDAFGNNARQAYNGGGCGAVGLSDAATTTNSVVLRGPGNAQTGYCYLNSSRSFSLHSTASTRGAAEFLTRVLVEPASTPGRQVRVFINGLEQVSAPVPTALADATSFKFGFAAATGGSTDIHEVRRVVVSSVTDVPSQLALAASLNGSTRPSGDTSRTISYAPRLGATGGPSSGPFTLTQTLPTGVTVSGTPTGTGWSCSASSGASTFSCTYPTGSAITPDSPLPTVAVPVTIAAGTPGGTDLKQGASVTDGASTGVATSSPSNALTVLDRADLSVALSAPTTVAPGATVSYSALVSNTGVDAADSLTFSAALPSGLTGAATSTAGCSITGGGSGVTCTRSALAAVADWTIAFTGTAPVDGSGSVDGTLLPVSATVTATTPDPSSGDNSDSASTTVEGSADLALSVVASGSPAPGGPVSYAVTVTNDGPHAARSLTVTGTLPSDLVLPATLTPGCGISGTTLTCTRAVLANGGATWPITVTGNAPADGSVPADGTTLTLSAVVAALTTDGVTSNDSDSDSASVTGSADLSTAVTGPATVAPGAPVTYTVTTHNDGPDAAASLALTQTLPAGLTGAQTASSGCTVSGSDLVCTRSALSAGADWVVTVSGTAPADTATPADGTALTTYAAITATTGDPDPSNNTSASLTTAVTGSADVRVELSGPARLGPGITGTWVLTVSNAGPDAARDLTLTDTLPAGLVGATSTTPGCAVTGRTLHCTRAALGVNGTWTVELTAGVPADGGGLTVGTALLNTATVSSLTADPVAADNTSTAVSTLVISAPPTPGPVTTLGSGTTPQAVVLSVPPGGSVTLLDAAGNAVTLLVVPGQGTYALDTATGTLSFVAAPGFTGTASPVTYRVTDAFGQVAISTYTPTVTAAAAPTALPVATPAGLEAGAKARNVLAGRRSTVPITCTVSVVSAGRINRCEVTLRATVSGRSVAIGRGTAAVNGSRSEQGVRTIRVNVRLNALGRSLAAQPGGTRATIAAVARRSSNGTLMRATTSTRVVARSVVLPRPVFFASDSDDLRAPDRRYLATLRRKLAGLRSITCTGYTDSQDDNRYNAFLGKQRAEVTCAFLVRGTCMTTVRVTKGERAPHATNSTADGRALNRRTEITLDYLKRRA